MTDLLKDPGLKAHEDGGLYFTRDGLRFRLIPGDKSKQYVDDGGPDWKVEWETPEYGWVPPTYSTLGILVTILADNEERLAPQNHPEKRNLRGRQMIADAFSQAAMKGWHTVRWSK